MEGEKTGKAGFNVPQDCRVTVKLRAEGGIDLKLSSKMEKMFGELIKKSAVEELEAAGIENAVVVIEDQGSLDFVIRASVKTAVRRAGGC